MKRIVLAFLIVSLYSGCLKNDTPKCDYDACATVAPASEIQAIKDYLTNNNITATQHCSGMFYAVDDPGSGTAPNGCSAVSVTYEGKLTNGNVFDQSATPTGFYLTQVIKGFENGIPLIKVGGKIRLYIPPSLGYGNRAVGNIPANSILIFTVQLYGVQ